jgi:uncharacterized protein YabE (DUF348 family)
MTIKHLASLSSSTRILLFISFLLVAIVFLTGVVRAEAANQHLITIHEGDSVRSIISNKDTLREAFADAGIAIDPADKIEPSVDKKLVSNDYQVNIYRARPITIVDGVHQIRVMTAYQTPSQIARQASVELRSEDKTQLAFPEDVVADGASLRLTIDRALPVQLDLYGKSEVVYTQATTVKDFLREKSITLTKDDRVSVDQATNIVANMQLRVWREGKQTVTVDEPIAPPTETVQDANQPIGYKKVQDEGKPGRKSVTYELIVINGQEVSRQAIQSVDIEQPTKQIVVVGIKPNGSSLSKSKGTYTYVDSNGVSHRETYYDLPMKSVMGNCGAGGVYSVRADGAKVDSGGNIIIAANLSRYPRCSIVETSLGPGKVYDTGGFAAKHPDGFDLATDWSNYDGI